jgi:hypothetical protein
MHIYRFIPALLLILAGFNLAVQSQQVQVSFGNPIQGAPGDSVFIVVSISNLTGLNVEGYNTTIAFDPEVFQIRHIISSTGVVTYSDIIQGSMSRTGSYFFVSNITSSNEIRVAVAGATPMAGSGSLFTIRARLGNRALYDGAMQLRVLDIGAGNLDVRPRTPYNLPVIVPSSVESENYIPASLTVFPAYPNPFNPETNIEYEINEAGWVSIEVFNISGKKISTIMDGFQTIGRHNQRFDASTLSSGIYLIRFVHNGQPVLSQRVTLLK